MDFLLSGLIKAFALLFSGDAYTWSAVGATLKVTSISICVSLVTGIPVGFMLGYFDFRGKRSLRTILDTLLALPTVFIGLVVYAFISSRGPLGEYQLLFTLTGIAIGQTILAFPTVAAITASTIENIDDGLKLTLVSLGAGKLDTVFTCLWETRYGILVAGVTAYGRILTEVGISMMVGGNIKWETRTMTTAIALETSRGMFSNGIALGLILLAIAFTVNFSLAFLRKK